MTHPSPSGREAVAVIGVALALPDADDLDALHRNLRAGRVSVRAPGRDRVHYAGAPADAGYLPLAYLDRIDLFDHRFFDLSRREAELMDPHQRMTAQLAHRALENACYAPRDLKGSRTAVVLSAPEPHYAGLYPDDDPQQVLGSHPSATAARISYLFDFAGPALVVDTACSSSLTALAVAVDQLRDGRADLAVAGGLSLYPVLIRERDYVPLLGIVSADGVCRPFDAAADGSTAGEGGGLVVLKRLSEALADGDHIHAVVRGVAVNQNGFRATSMSAPSARAQSAAIVEAWRQSGGAPPDYVECHGSGTRLGDVIEAEGLRQAFAEAGADADADAEVGTGVSCGISSIKGNIGHINHAAGVAGLLKVLAGLRHGTRYPNPNFSTPNPLIDFSGPVRVDAEAKDWEPAPGATRRAGVSSFGLTGTNVHAVIEEPPAVPPAPAPPDPESELVTLSAKSPRALAAYAERVADFLGSTGHRLADIAHALNRGRDDHPYRWAGTVRDRHELAAALRGAPHAEREPAAAAPLVLLFSGDAELGDGTWAALCAAFPALADADGGRAEGPPGARLFARHLAVHRLARALGLAAARLVGSGVGNLAVRSVQSPATADESRLRAADTPVTSQVDESGLRRAARGLVDEGAVAVELAADGTLARELARVAPELPVVRLFADPTRDGVLSALGRLYSLGADIDWNAYYAGTGARRVEVPTYPFDADAVSCWCLPPGGPPPDRAPEPDQVPGRVPARQAEPGATEAELAALWQRVLKADAVGPDSNYFELGGTSIAGITVLRAAEEHFGARLTFADLHRNPTLRALAARIDAVRATGTGRDDWTITPVPRPGRLPLSFNQEQLWYLDRLNPGSPLYNIPANTRYVGDFDLVAFRGALRDVVDRHEVLRTRILDEDGSPYALADTAEPQVDFVDLTALPEEQRTEALSRAITAEATAPFDLGRGPLLRTVVVKAAEHDHVVLHTVHHIAFDGWAPAVFFRELSACYSARIAGRAAGLPELPVQYADFAAWQRRWLDAERVERGLAYWRRQLRDLDAPELPLDRPRPAAQSYRGGYVKFTLDEELARRLRAFSAGESTTSFVTMLAVVDALLHLWAGRRDVVVGAATTGRFNPATHDLIGYFNNLLPFRTRVDPGIGFRDLVVRCAATATGVLDHEEIPFARIVADADHRDPSRHPVFTVCYTHQNTVAASLDLEGLRPVALRGDLAGVSGVAPGTSKFDLTFGLYDQDDSPMDGYLEYAVDLFDAATAHRLVALFQDIAEAVMSDPDRPLADLAPLLDATGGGHRGGHGGAAPSLLVGERRALTDTRLVSEVFQEHAARRPAEAAVIDAAGEHTFQEIDRRANRLARRLVAHGVGPDGVVPVLAARGADLVVGWLGVHRAGAAFASLDPAVPERRLRSVLAGVDAAALVLGEGMSIVGPESVPVLRVPDAAEDPDRDEGGAPPRRASPRDLAYVVHTSGSTGHPQGCEVEHGGLLNVLTWCGDTFGIGPGDRLAQLAATGFDLAVFEVMTALYHGAALYFVADPLQTPDKLLADLAEHRVTVACMPTPLAETVLADLPDVPGPAALRLVLTGGDLLRVRPPRRTPFDVHNIYGPTECAVCVTGGPVAAAGTVPDAVPDIGGPLPNVRVHVLDARLRPVARGERGEVYAGGAHVGRGYHGRPGPTAARFVADPFADEPGARMYRTGDLALVRADGTLAFHGRADDQLELRGHRVEPAEVERALLAHPRVREALVHAAEQPSGAPLLVAHVAGDDAPDEAELTEWVARALPEYMVPGRVRRHAALPRTSNGKLDRRTTRKRDMADRDTTHELTAVVTTVTPGAVLDDAGREAERVLAGIWTELLGVARVAPDDNFFRIGGDSLLSVGIASRATRAGLPLTPHDVLSHPTLRDLAAVAAKGAGPLAGAAAGPTAGPATVPDAAPRPDAAASAPREPVPPAPLVQALLATARDGARDFVTPLLLETAAGIGADAVRAAFDRLIEVQEPLRYRFRHNSLGWRIECAERESARVVDHRVLPPLDEEQLQAYLEADLDELLADVDPGRGPVLRARFYDRGADRPGVIVLAIHHFVFDSTSFVPLVEDLNAAFAGDAPAAVPRRAAWRAWTHLLRAMAASDEVAGELPYWKGVLSAAAGSRPVPENGADGAPAGLVRRRVAADRVAARLTESGPAGQSAALAAVAVAWSRWRGEPDAFLSTVGMGSSPNALWNGDRSDAIGWFTHLFPAHLRVPSGARVVDALPGVDTVLRSVPNDGIGYGVLRHLSPATPAVASVRALPEPPVLVEHVASGNDGLTKLGGPHVRPRPMTLVAVPHSLLTQVPIVVETHILGGTLELGVIHRGSVAAADMEDFADHVVEALTELAADEGR
ncbi:non-ribosomal peptide synthetase [Streptomyces sp. NRRL B-1347]|uniref:non-ribosomal peptide synthetase n=1 Tax=Streptomyces sp. NRRL B-1347 TaxID=1476877 RepID=UPI000690C834|nr:non-ribosomal peptide synthetase [Streptomyces sp. NRRL B-1347]